MAKLSLGVTDGKAILALVTGYRLKIDKHTQESTLVFSGYFEQEGSDLKTNSLVMPVKLAEKVKKTFDKSGLCVFSFDGNGMQTDIKAVELASWLK